MKVLGISSGIGVTGAGIAGDEGILAEFSVASPAVQSEKLAVLIDEVLKRARLSIKDVDAVAVTTGPGSYSGLRGGLATAKGLVEGLKVPLLTVSTLRAIAFNLINTEGAIAVAVNACREDYNFAMFASRGGKLKRLTSDISVKAQNIKGTLEKVKGSMILACDAGMKKLIRNKNIIFADEKDIVPWGINVARIGMEKLRKKETSDPILAKPSYSHKPNIKEYKD